MTIYPTPPAPFHCAICNRPQMLGLWDKHLGPEMPIPPLCRYCEKYWGKAIGGWGDRKPDHRIIRQISALAAVIEATAHCKLNGHRGPYDRA